MSRQVVAALIAAAGCVASAQSPGDDPSSQLPAGVVLLARIKRHVRDEMARQPDYTCLQTTQRYRKANATATPKPFDIVRLEVLDTGGKEMYALPGAREFEDYRPAIFSGTGLSGTGVYSIFLRDLLVHDNGTFQYQGEEDLAGHRTVRYDYRVTLLQSGFTIGVDTVSARVASNGSFWVDPESLDLLRLDIHADDIPPDLPLASSVSVIDYARTRIGERSIVLPQSAEVDLVETSGVEGHNILDFTHCRAFQAESQIQFGGATPSNGGQADSPEATGGLRPGLTIALKLSTPVGDGDAVGTPIEARVAADVVRKRKLVLKAGTVVRGRIRRLDHYSDSSGYFVVALEFNEIDTGAGPVAFYAELQETDPPAGLEHPRGVAEAALPGVGTFRVSGDAFTLRKGFGMVWKTIAL